MRRGPEPSESSVGGLGRPRSARNEVPHFVPDRAHTDFMNRWGVAGQAPARIGVRDDGFLVAEFENCILSSAFHTIFDAASPHARAAEGLVRVQDAVTGRVISPLELFARPRSDEAGIFLDRLCRYLHLRNFERQEWSGLDLYLNLDAHHLNAMRPGMHGEFFDQLLKNSSLEPQSMILEITESEFDDRERLTSITRSYAEHGFRIAIDDFGARHSNFDRIWALEPSVVKIDRDLLIQAEKHPRARLVLPRLVDIMHELGAAVVCEGIETPAQYEAARLAQADFLQGFLLSRPLVALQRRPLVQGLEDFVLQPSVHFAPERIATDGGSQGRTT